MGVEKPSACNRFRMACRKYKKPSKLTWSEAINELAESGRNAKLEMTTVKNILVEELIGKIPLTFQDDMMELIVSSVFERVSEKPQDPSVIQKSTRTIHCSEPAFYKDVLQQSTRVAPTIHINATFGSAFKKIDENHYIKEIAIIPNGDKIFGGTCARLTYVMLDVDYKNKYAKENYISIPCNDFLGDRDFLTLVNKLIEVAKEQISINLFKIKEAERIAAIAAKEAELKANAIEDCDEDEVEE